MLLRVRISNYALIQELELQIPKGLTTITGETGAGKSILLGALGLLTGNRADHSVLFDDQKKCIVEGEFDLEHLNLKPFFDAEDLDYWPQTLLRREIAPGGKSRCFINDTPVTLSQAKALGSQLLEIHTQHTHLLVTQRDEQMKLLDSFAGHSDLLNAYHRSFHAYTKAKRLIKEALQRQAEQDRERDYNEYLYQELAEFQPQEGEESHMESEMALLSQGEELKSLTLQSSQQLSQNEGSLLDQLNQIKASFRRYKHSHPTLDSLLDRLEQLGLDLDDISEGLSQFGDAISEDPERLSFLNERMAQLQNLFRKHHVSDACTLISIAQELEKRLQSVQLEQEQLAEWKKEAEMHSQECHKLAQKLHESRSLAGLRWCQELQSMLHSLEIPDARLECQWATDASHLNPQGYDELTLMFSANKGQALQPLEKVASGGELSRLNFSIRSLGAAQQSKATLIYDEADTGISGPVALQMGRMMRSMGQHLQVLAITHLPQVASAGHQQLLVFKDRQSEHTASRFQWLNQTDRIQQLAQLLSHENPTASALANAQELLESFD